MSKGRTNFAVRNKPAFVLKMRELGYLVEQNQETISVLMGLAVALAEEVDMLNTRLKLQEARQPSTFIR